MQLSMWRHSPALCPAPPVCLLRLCCVCPCLNMCPCIRVVVCTAEASKQLRVPMPFLTTIVVPLVGNAAEHASAVVFAVKNRMEISLGVAMGKHTRLAWVLNVCESEQQPGTCMQRNLRPPEGW